MWSRTRDAYDAVPSAHDDDDDRHRTPMTMMMMPTAMASSIDPFAGERASLTGRGDVGSSRRASTSSMSFGRVTEWVGARASAWGVACAATFALGVATGAMTMTRGTVTATATLGASSAPVPAPMPQLGLTQYQRALLRAREANGNPGAHDRGDKPGAARKKARDAPDEEEYDEESYEEAMGGLFAQKRDTRTVIPGVKAELESERAKLVEDDYGEDKMGYYRFPSVTGNKLAFVSESNIWIGNVHGGKAARLSSTYSREGVFPGFG